MGRFSLEVVADVIAGRMNVGKRGLIAFSAPWVPGDRQFGTLRAVISSFFHGNFEALAILAPWIFSLRCRRYDPTLKVAEADELGWISDMSIQTENWRDLQ